jgi:lysophospholipase L1-like esterase
MLTGLVGPVGEGKAQVKIMPLGDSITVGAGSPQLGGYRLPLWEYLMGDHWDAEFVGSQSNGPPELGSKNHEGLGGWRIDQIDAWIDDWLDTYQPDIILLMIGTNDCVANYQFSAVRKRMEHLIDKISRRLPDSFLIVSTLLPIRDKAANARVQQFNRFLPDIVWTRALKGQRILMVDMNRMLNPLTDMPDGIHPNVIGYDKMAALWYVAVEFILLVG